MMRNILVTLIFFFGPAILMVVVRNIFLLWRANRLAREQEPEVIDITPIEESATPSRFFIASAVTVGLIFAYFAWSQLDFRPPTKDKVYQPAHINAQGELVPAQHLPRTPKTTNQPKSE